jgi:hypothetical protein
MFKLSNVFNFFSIQTFEFFFSSSIKISILVSKTLLHSSIKFIFSSFSTMFLFNLARILFIENFTRMLSNLSITRSIADFQIHRGKVILFGLQLFVALNDISSFHLFSIKIFIKTNTIYNI